jgi:hypothetical protein
VTSGDGVAVTSGDGVAVTRLRHLQLALGVLWIVDALLQLQPANLGSGLASTLVGSAMGQPPWIQDLLVWASESVGRSPVAIDLVIGTVQLCIGAAILVPRTRRRALLVSIVWALAVWVLGEGLGGVATGFAMLPTGGPGPALLYAVAAAVVLPPARRGGEGPAGASPAESAALGDRGGTVAWGLLWLLAAGLQVMTEYSLGFKLSANLQMASLGEPASLAHLDVANAHFAAAHGPEVTVLLVTVELAAASAAVLRGRWRARALLGTLAVCLVFWVVGENFGGLLTGSATDVGAMPLYLVLGTALLPVLDRSRRTAQTTSASSSPSAGSARSARTTEVAAPRTAASAPRRDTVRLVGDQTWPTTRRCISLATGSRSHGASSA